MIDSNMRISKKSLSAFIFVITSLVASNAAADLVFSPTVYYSEYRSKDNNDTDATTSTRSMLLDFRLGYAFAEGYYIGGIYGLEDTVAGESRTSATAAHYGPSLGIVMGSFNLIGHYFIKADRVEKPSTTRENRYSDGGGYQLDLGWTFMLGPSFGMGPQLTWVNYTYKKRTQTDSGVATEGTQSYNITWLYPRIAFWFAF